MSVIENFRQEIANAIDTYKIKVKTVSSDRKEDVKKLENIFKNSWTGLGDYIFAVEEFINQLKTGIGIFQTGNSQLKAEIMKVLNFYNNPIIRLLIKMEHENRGKEEATINYLDKLTNFIGYMKSSSESRRNFEAYKNNKKNCQQEKINYENLARARF